MGVLDASSILGMAVFTVLLVALALWAQSFRRHPRNIIGNRNYFLMGSGIFVLVCLLGMGYRLANGGFNLGMDFTGGTVIEVGFYDNTDSLTTQKIADAVMAVDPDLKQPQVQLEQQVVRNLVTEPSASPSSPASAAPAASASGQASPAPSTAPSASPHGFRPTGVTPVQLESSPAASSSPAADASASPGASSSPSAASSPLNMNSKPYVPAIIRLGKRDFTPLTSKEIDTLLEKLEPKLGHTTPPLSIESVSPVIGSELFSGGIKALLIALFLQLLYITFRFGNQWSYGIAADVALVHDIIIMTGVYVIFNRQIDSPFLAALLTVIGYSVMDSIVIFDRIRENFRLNRKADFEEVVNKSVNETMTRSINTLMTVLLCLFALYFLGESTLKNFAFALLVGVTSGGYSSIFIASPILVMWDKWSRARESEAVANRRANLQPSARAAADEERDPDEDEDKRSAGPRDDRAARRRASSRRRRG